MSGLLAVKLRRDLRATWPRTLMMVVAIAVSLIVFSGMLFTWRTSAREMEHAYLSTEPASATIAFRPAIDAEEMAAIADQAGTLPGIIEAAGRTRFSGRIQNDAGEWQDNNLQVFAIAPDDPLRMASFEVRQGSWPPAEGEILLAAGSLSLLDVSVGETVVVETPARTPRSEQPRLEPTRLRVAGVVYDPSLTPPARTRAGTGYMSTASLAALGVPDVMNRLKIQVADQPGQATPSRDRDAIETVANETGEWLQSEHGLAIRAIQVPDPYRHPHQAQADTLFLTFLIASGIALLLSTILVANMLNNLFAQQIPQIGIMKAIGARSGRVARLYLAMTLLVATAATLLALAPGTLGGRAGASAVLEFVDVDAASLVAPWWTYLVVLAAGLALPVLMALIPLIRTSRTTVRAAIDYQGLSSNPRVATGVLARLARLPRLGRGLLMALRNSIRRPARFLLSVGLLASAGMVFIAATSLTTATLAVAEEATNRLQWDVEVRLDSATSIESVRTILEPVDDIDRMEGWTSAGTAGLAVLGEVPLTRSYPDQRTGSISVTAFPRDTAMLTPPRMLEGRWLNPGETGAIVLNQVARADTVPDVGAGDTIELSVGQEPTTWRVVGIAEERGGRRGNAYLTAEGLAETFSQAPQRVNTLRIATSSHDEPTREAVADAVEEALTGAGIEVSSAASIGQREEAIQAGVNPIFLVLLTIATAMAVVGCIGLASTMSVNILDRTREFGVMHAIGARPKAVRRIVIAEGVFIALVSYVVAAIPALGLTVFMSTSLGNLFMETPLPLRISMPAVVIWTVLIVVGAVVATNAAATRASRLTVRDALAYL